MKITIGELKFFCRTAGEPGRPLLLFLHGFPEFSGGWDEMLSRLSDQFYCVAPDQRGYGQSSKPDGVGSYAAGKLASDAAAILTHFAPRARAVVGHDWGASVAYALSIARPALIEKLVIMNGAHPIPFQLALAAGGAQSAASQYFHDLRSAQAETRLAANNFAELAALFGGDMDMSWLAGERRNAYLNAWSQPGALTAILNWYRATPFQVALPGVPIPAENLVPLSPSNLRIRMPHLLIWGMNDTALLPESYKGLGALCSDLTLVELEQADHWLHHQKPDEVADIIRKFCTD